MASIFGHNNRTPRSADTGPTREVAPIKKEAARSLSEPIKSPGEGKMVRKENSIHHKRHKLGEGVPPKLGLTTGVHRAAFGAFRSRAAWTAPMLRGVKRHTAGDLALSLGFLVKFRVQAVLNTLQVHDLRVCL